MSQPKKASALLLAFLVFLARGNCAENRSPDVVSGYLSALAYLCEQRSIIARLEQPDSGYEAYLDKKLKEATSCIEGAKIDGKKAYQESVAKYPGSKESLAKVYARWLTHLDTMLYYYDEEKQESTRAPFVDAQNELKASLDAEQPAI